MYQSEIYAPLPSQHQLSTTNDYIELVNKRTSILQDFSSALNIKVYRRLTINLTGGIVFDKPLQSSIHIDSRLGRELILGSNSNEFWFYSKRMDQPFLYYADHADINKTGLKAPFYPLWMMQGLGLEPIAFKSSPKYEKDDFCIRVVGDEKGPNGSFVRRVVLIDPTRSLIHGSYLYDDNNSLIASMEINNYVNVAGMLVPQKIRMICMNNGDKSVMDIELFNIKVNVGRKSNNVRPANLGTQVDMAK